MTYMPKCINPRLLPVKQFGRGVNGLQMIIERDLQPLSTQYKMVFEEMMQQKYIEETSVEIIVEHRSGAEPKCSDKNKKTSN